MSITKNIIIKLTNQAVWFNDEMFLALKDTNLPAGEFEFTQGRDIFWKSEMLAYDRNSGALTLRIVNYRPVMIDDFLNQKPKAEVTKSGKTIKHIKAISPQITFSDSEPFYTICCFKIKYQRL